MEFEMSGFEEAVTQHKLFKNYDVGVREREVHHRLFPDYGHRTQPREKAGKHSQTHPSCRVGEG